MVEDFSPKSNKKYTPDQQMIDSEKQYARDFMSTVKILLHPRTAFSQPVRMNCICTICSNVLWDPVECNNCSTPFCQSCIKKKLDDNLNCPDCNQEYKERQINKFSKLDLQAMRFYWSKTDNFYDYRDAIAH